MTVLEHWFGEGEGDEWKVRRHFDDTYTATLFDGPGAWSASAETAPLAICRAALAAIDGRRALSAAGGDGGE